MKAKSILKAIEEVYGLLELDDTSEAMKRLTDLGVEIRIRVECTIKRGENRKTPKAKTSKAKAGKPGPSKPNQYRGKKPTGLDALAIERGYKSYASYLDSDHWKNIRRSYGQAWPDCRCLGCGSSRYNLHHICYDRLGREFLYDMIPLCQTCHDLVHRTHKRNRIPIREFKDALAAAFGWGPAQLSQRLEMYHRLPHAFSWSG